ncbi:helix-turn-helix transcriptional regulator, partial [Vibrio fluvialis]|uniref:helix-turn-helix domain-containing protein n=1 Tax=Vibrio fluvialis TaxID=676 RepID=UPI001ABDF532
MSECQHVITELKKQLKLHGIQYQDIAYALNLSEGSVKRLLAEGSHLSLERLAIICQLMGMELTELFRLVADKQTLLSALTFEQEKQLVSDKALLLVAVCVINGYRFDDMLQQYQFSEPQLIQKLALL